MTQIAIERTKMLSQVVEMPEIAWMVDKAKELNARGDPTAIVVAITSSKFPPASKFPPGFRLLREFQEGEKNNNTSRGIGVEITKSGPVIYYTGINSWIKFLETQSWRQTVSQLEEAFEIAQYHPDSRRRWGERGNHEHYKYIYSVSTEPKK